MMLSLLTLLTAQADCTLPGLQAQVGSSREGFSSMQLDVFSGAVVEIEQTLSCLDVVPAAPVVASVHEVFALDRFLQQNLVENEAALARARSETLVAFEAAVRADKDYSGPGELAPVGNQLHQQFQSATLKMVRSPTVETAALPRLRGASFSVDGIESRVRPAELPVLVQVVDGDTVLHSAYLWPDEPLPEWPLPLANAWVRPAVLVSTGGMALTSGVLWASGLIAANQVDVYRDDLDSAGATKAEIQQLADQANRRGVAAQITSGLTGGLLVWYLVIR